MITVSFVFNRKKETKGERPAMVEIRITDRRKSWYVSTGIKVLKSEWQEGSIVNRNDANMLNKRLRVLIDLVGDEVDKCILEGRTIDVDYIKRKVSGSVEAERETFLEWVRKEIPKLRHSEGTMKHYGTLLSRLSEFGGLKHWQDLTSENIYKWDAWLHQLPKPQTQAERLAGAEVEGISDAGVYNYHKRLKALLNRAVKLGKIEASPYQRLTGEFPHGEKENVEYLTEDEIKAFEAIRPLDGSRMRMVRDLFVFQMHTGMSYADTQVFDFSKWRKIDGRWVYVGPRVKTGVDYVAQLDETCMEILQQYSMNLPKINLSDYNMQLKALGMAAGIAMPLHSHLARHTFATYMLARNAPIHNVAKMLGHKDIKMTQRYAKVLAENVLKDLTRVWD